MSRRSITRPVTPGLLLNIVLCFMSFSFAAKAVEEQGQERKAFKVCADPYSLPSSNKREEGYENKIANLFAKDLGLPVMYEWFPQRIGFIRKTLKNNDTPDGSFKCDIVMGEVDSFDAAAVTDTYFRSTWTMVFVKGRGFDDIKKPTDLANLPEDRKSKLRIGLFDQSPASLWLGKYDLLQYAVPYQSMTGDARAYPGQIIEQDLVTDKINMTFVWGPIGGYFAKKINAAGKSAGTDKSKQEVVVLPMQSEPGIKFDFGIAMAVRFGDKAWKQQINALIHKHGDDIRQILTSYGVPVL